MEDLSISQAISQIGAKLGRSQEELSDILQLFTKNWITKLSQWKGLSKDRKSLFKLPLLLEQELENFTVGKKADLHKHTDDETNDTNQKKRKRRRHKSGLQEKVEQEEETQNKGQIPNKKPKTAGTICQSPPNR